MPTHRSDHSDWTPLHDLALIYLALMHGADAEIDPAETHVTAAKLLNWHPGEDESQVEQVMKDVMLVYVGGSSQQMLDTSVISLRETMPKGQRIAVLNDLAEIASADGMVVHGEISFIQQLAHHWGIEDADIQADN